MAKKRSRRSGKPATPARSTKTRAPGLRISRRVDANDRSKAIVIIKSPDGDIEIEVDRNCQVRVDAPNHYSILRGEVRERLSA